MKVDLSKYKHKIEVPVRYADLDTLQHVNNATYLSYLEEARIDYFKQNLAFDKSTLDFRCVVARVEISYRKSIEIDDKVELYTRCSKIGTKSLDFETMIMKSSKSGKQELAAKSTVTLVSIDSEKGIAVNNDTESVKQIRNFEKHL